MGDLGVDATDGQVYLRQSPGGVVRLLAVNGDVGFGPAAVAVPVGVRVYEFQRLDEHAGGATAWVVHPAVIGLQHLDQERDHATRRVKLTAFLPSALANCERKYS